ncbi:MAG: calcium/sodium antiporter [Sphaerochaetaceae bacterium]|mgnify:FL=1|nr:calcium/sodium antiporter [Sphaerochaetaceae bacterium]
MIQAVLLFIVGLICLIKGGDWFVDSSTAIAKRFHVPEILIGATVVSIGTTLPEVMVSATSAVIGHGEIAYGNAIGSVICNTALISAITIAIRPSSVNGKELKVPVAFFFVAAAFYCVCSYALKGFPRWCGLVLLSMFIIYIALQVKDALGKMKNKTVKESEDEEEDQPMWKVLFFFVIGAALIAIGADLLVDNGTIIAQSLGVPESVIALTFVALGTSLPELVTAITSLAKGHSALSVGNIVGANLFNLVLVSGVSVTLSPFALPSSKTIGGMNASLVLDIPLMLFVMAFMTIPAIVKNKLSRFQGIILLIVYFSFCIFQFV